MKMTLLREARGWSKAELARRASLAEADVSKIESGRLTPYDTQLRKLARALGVPISQTASLLRTRIDTPVPSAKRPSSRARKPSPSSRSGRRES